MRIVIAGGRGFLGSALRCVLQDAGHDVAVLTRRKQTRAGEIHWDGATLGDWTEAISGSDAVVNACGYGLEHWPWTASQKRRFAASRVEPGQALAAGIERARHRPRLLVQFSGINLYGLQGETPADEATAAADDFLARLAVRWEAASEPVETMGVRRVVVRNAIVLDRHEGLFPLMSLACRLFAGGRFGDGQQAVPWIHRQDQIMAIKRLLESEDCKGPYNLVAPHAVTNAEFMRSVCQALRRPYWFHMPAFGLRLVLGEMAVMILAGRASQPRRLLEDGFQFAFPTLDAALQDLFESD